MADLRTNRWLQKTTSFFIFLVQLALYSVIQIVFIPIAFVGLIDGIYRGIFLSKRMNVSFSACRALQYKWFMHYFETRSDPLSVAFIKSFPCESHWGLLSTFGALIISQRLLGFTTRFGRIDKPGEENILSFPGPRVLMFDEILKKHVCQMDQIVVPGAGFDLSPLQFTQGKGVKVFELDQVETINAKIDTLKKAGIAHDWITYIPVDYSRESWSEKLLENGFDRTKKTLFFWQSVSLFLEAEDVRETLHSIAELCGDGSIVAQDFYSKAYISGEISKTVKRASRMIEKREPWKFGIDTSTQPRKSVQEFLNECGLEIVEIHQFGEKLRIEPFYFIVEAQRLHSAGGSHRP